MRALAEEPPTDIRACVGRLLEFATGANDEELRAELSRVVGGIQAPTIEPQTAEPAVIRIDPEPVRRTVPETVLVEGA
jgi:hypothetical protein